MSPSESDLSVTLVIPGRNAADTLRPCLEAVVSMLERGELAEIIFVDDGSTDETAKIAAEFPVRCVEGPARGPGGHAKLTHREGKSGREPLLMHMECRSRGSPAGPGSGGLRPDAAGEMRAGRDPASCRRGLSPHLRRWSRVLLD